MTATRLAAQSASRERAEPHRGRSNVAPRSREEAEAAGRSRAGSSREEADAESAGVVVARGRQEVPKGIDSSARCRRKRRSPSTSPEPEEEPEPEPFVPDVLTDESLDAFYATYYDSATDDPDAATAALATSLGIEDHLTDGRAGAKLDFIVNTLSFARDGGFSVAQTHALFDLALLLLKIAADDDVDFTAAEGYFKNRLVMNVSATPAEGKFTVDDVKVISAHFASGFFAHFKLFAFMYRRAQALEQHVTKVRVETAVRFPGLYLSLPEEEHEAKLVARAERAEAARVAKEEEEAAARAEEERARKEAEEEKRRAAEEAYANSKPKTLDEAVEHAVRTKMALEKAALESEYKAREEQLMEKISVLEAQLAG